MASWRELKNQQAGASLLCTDGSRERWLAEVKDHEVNYQTGKYHPKWGLSFVRAKKKDSKGFFFLEFSTLLKQGKKGNKSEISEGSGT